MGLNTCGLRGIVIAVIAVIAGDASRRGWLLRTGEILNILYIMLKESIFDGLDCLTWEEQREIGRIISENGNTMGGRSP